LPFPLYLSTLSAGFKAILDNPDIHHRVLKDFPLLGALTGFSTIKDNRRLSAEEVRWQIRGKRRRKREGNPDLWTRE
jgi:hypothetical protein